MKKACTIFSSIFLSTFTAQYLLLNYSLALCWVDAFTLQIPSFFASFSQIRKKKWKLVIPEIHFNLNWSFKQFLENRLFPVNFPLENPPREFPFCEFPLICSYLMGKCPSWEVWMFLVFELQTTSTAVGWNLGRISPLLWRKDLEKILRK